MKASNLPIVPASFFGMVLGLAGLGGTWRAAHLAWGLPALTGELVTSAAALVWLAVATLYGLKWLVAREAALTEAAHPVQCCFIGLAGVATMLVAAGVIPYSHGLAVALYVMGAVFTAGFAVWRSGGLWRGERDPGHTTPAASSQPRSARLSASPISDSSSLAPVSSAGSRSNPCCCTGC